MTTTKISIEVTNEPVPGIGRFMATIRQGSIECHCWSARADNPSIDLATDREVIRSIRDNFNHKVLKTIESLLPTAE